MKSRDRYNEYDDDNFTFNDEFEGNNSGLFASADNDDNNDSDDDIELRVHIKNRMESLRNARNHRIEAGLKVEIQTMFNSFVPLPDTLFNKSMQENQHYGNVVDNVLLSSLDRLSRSFPGLPTLVDPNGYLTYLISMNVGSKSEVYDFSKARLLLKYITHTNQKHPHCWIAAARLEELAGEVLDAQHLIQKGCEECPKSVDVWLEACHLMDGADGLDGIIRGNGIPLYVNLWLDGVNFRKERGLIRRRVSRKGVKFRKEGGLNKRRVSRKGVEHVLDSVRGWKAAVLANEEDSRLWLRRSVECFPLHVVGMILAKARESGGNEWVWMKSAILERESGNVLEERRILEDGLKPFPTFFKLWLMLGQLEERIGNLDQARKIYKTGLIHCHNCVPLWLSVACLEEKVNGLSKARVILTIARKKNPQNPELWLAAIRAESRHGNKSESGILMAKALQECPTSGILWAASIEMAPRPQQKEKSRDACHKCVDDPHVLAAVAKIFWQDRKFDKARFWLHRAVALAPDVGDFWALCYRFELQHGTEETQKVVLNGCVLAQPKHGEKWQAVSKALENSHQPTEVILKKVLWR